MTGDPASISALGGLLVRSGVAWLADADRVSALRGGGLGEGRPARAAAADLDALAGRLRTLGEAARTAGAVLQGAATRLADHHDRLERLHEDAARAGLAVRDEQVVPALGIRGLADAGQAGHLAVTREQLQGRLDVVLAEADRDRRALEATVGDLVPVIEREATALRLT